MSLFLKMVDEFIPELIEMLASQMNPTMVCSTALLCNNAWVDGVLSEYKAVQSQVVPKSAINGHKCEMCQAFMESTSQKLQKSSIDDVHHILSNVGGSNIFFLQLITFDFYLYRFVVT